MEQASRVAGTVRPGGRTARVRAAVLQATQDELVEHGFYGLTMDQVAARAGVGKTTVYRRWGSRAGLVTDLMTELADQTSPRPDPGSVEEHLRAGALALCETVNDGRLGATFQAMIAAGTYDKQAADALRAFYLRRIEEWAGPVELAVQRGELPEGTDAMEVVRAVSAPLYYRLVVTREPVTPEVAEHSVARALIAARAGAFIP
jgi:AcrR family transcriptional regulator